jgi:hypothetical protein
MGARTMFLLYLAGPIVALGYFCVLGLLHR